MKKKRFWFICNAGKYILTFFSFFLFYNAYLRAQNITSSEAIVLPASPLNSYIVESGQSAVIKSSHSITLRPGTHFKIGSNVILGIENIPTVPVAPSNPNANLNMNWKLNRAYSANGTVISEQKAFFDNGGNLLQQQYKDLSSGHVIASHTVYDAAGRPSLSTLPAPINNGEFAFKSDFVQNPSGAAYTYHNFDRYRNGNSFVDKVHTPDAVGGKSNLGTLGWYYSNNNSWEPYVDVTDYPYSRQLYAFDGTGLAIKSGMPGDEYRVGNGREQAQYVGAVANELQHYFQIRNRFFSTDLLGELSTDVKSSSSQKTFRDADGRHIFQISTSSGSTLVTGSGSSGNNGDLVVNNNIVLNASTSTFYYFAIHSPTSVVITGNSWVLQNMLDNGNPASNFSSGSVLNKGFYKLVMQGNSEIHLSYSNRYADLQYNYYNQLGQLVASIAPEGVKKLMGTGLNAYNNKESIPFITLYNYDAQGRLQSVKEPDLAGSTEYVYRKDGSVRFSQNALQRADGRYAYSNYDATGRIIEVGIYKPGTSGVTFNASRTTASVMRNILEDQTQEGGLANGTKYDVVRYKYDLVDNSHGQSNYVQDSYFLRGAVSVSEKYSTIVNNVVSAQNLISKSWYNYNADNLIDWHISYINGLGYKTTDYSYDEFGALTKQVYQRHVANEFLAYYYEYDKDRRPLAIYTNTVDNSNSKIVHARYQYYLHGPLKRVELGDNVQGIDYVYTADGKLKAVNNPNPAFDPGSDGTANSFSKDVFGYSLEYHPNDYRRANTNIKNIQGESTTALYNGLPNGIVWSTTKPSSAGGARTPVMNTYSYDNSYQLTANHWGIPNFTAATFGKTVDAWQEKGLTYDSHGNIKTLQRSNGNGELAANYTYNYVANSNKLASVGSYGSYTYDALGQLNSETKAGQTKYLTYDGTGKVTAIYSDAAKTIPVLSFAYDEGGARIKKQDHLQNVITWYVNGNVYNGSQLIEQPIPNGQFYTSGSVYRYQLTDHVGTVRAIINRNKLSNGNADVVYYADYYPFGTVLQSAGVGSRYGYQGEFAEKDEETGWNNFYLRDYDPAIGRWLSTDPYGQYYSPYVGMGNNPVTGFDPDGGQTQGHGGGIWSSIKSFFGFGESESIFKAGGWGGGGAKGYWDLEDIVDNHTYGGILLKPVYVLGKANKPSASMPALFNFAALNSSLNSVKNISFNADLFSISARPESRNNNYGSQFLAGASVGLLGAIAPDVAAVAANGGGQLLLTAGKLHKHHVLPQQFRKWFAQRGISNIDDYAVQIGQRTHLKGVHGKGLGAKLPGGWNTQWSDFIKSNPKASPSEIFNHAEGLLKRYGLEYLRYVPYK